MEFKPIKGYEGIYEACSDGTIWSCEGKTTYSNWHGRIRKRVWKRRKHRLQTQKRQRGVKRDKRKLAELQAFFEYIELNKQNLFDLCGMRGELA